MIQKEYIDKLAWIYLKDKKILSTRSKGKDTYYIPGGKRDPGESDEAALIREIKEELTIDLIPETIKHVGTYEAQAHGKLEGTVVRMTCYSADFTGSIAPSSEIEEVVWFTHADKDKSSAVDKIIFDDLAQKGLLA